MTERGLDGEAEVHRGGLFFGKRWLDVPVEVRLFEATERWGTPQRPRSTEQLSRSRQLERIMRFARSRDYEAESRKVDFGLIYDDGVSGLAFR